MKSSKMTDLRRREKWLDSARACWGLIAWLTLASWGPAAAESLDSSVQRHLREATFEVVLGKPEVDPLSYEKPLPLDLLPFAERTSKYRSIGTAFAIGKGRFVTAAHVIAAGYESQYKPIALRDASGKIYIIDQVLKFSVPEDYAVFTLKDAPKVSALDTRDRPALNDPVFAVGDALGEGIVIRDGLYTSDTLEEKAGRWKWIRFSAAASPGNSGGPLVDRKGKVIGVVLRKSPSENLNVAVAIEQVLKGGDTAVLDTRATYRFPFMLAGETNEFEERFPLPKSIDDFYAASSAAFKDARDKGHAQYLSLHGARMFPHGDDSQPLLHTLYVAAFPRVIEERNDGKWGVTDPKPQREELEQNGYVENAPIPGGKLIRLRIPDGMKWSDLYGNSQLFMDLVLKGLPVRRPVGAETVRVTSMGKAAVDTTVADEYGRTWQLRSWTLPYADSVILALLLPTPQGYIGIVTQSPNFQQAAALDELRSLTPFIYVSFFGTLKQWDAYLSASLEQPAVVKALTVRSDYGKNFSFHSARFDLNVPNSIQKIAAESVLTIKFSYFADHGATVWDVAGLHLGDPEQKANGIDVVRHQEPLPSLPEAFTERWHTLESGSHPYTGTAYTLNGNTRIDAVAGAKSTGGGHRSIIYSAAVVAEGTQDQAKMKHSLDVLQAGLKVLERD